MDWFNSDIDWRQAIEFAMLGSITFAAWEAVKILRAINASLHALRGRFLGGDED
ncbi:MAG: hypothetical protein ACM30I_13500 [Gemmatimonas sp.]